MLVCYLLLGSAILLGVVGPILLKSGAQSAVTIEQQFLNPLTVGGFGMYVVSGLLYVMALKKILCRSPFLQSPRAMDLWQSPHTTFGKSRSACNKPGASR